MATQEEIFDLYWNISDRGKRIKEESKTRVSEIHRWGIHNNALERSPTLKRLVEEVYDVLPKNKIYTNILIKVMSELNLRISSTDMKTIEKQVLGIPDLKVCVVLRVDSTPQWSFEGFGRTKAEAIESASKRGIRFFIAVSSDKVLFE